MVYPRDVITALALESIDNVRFLIALLSALDQSFFKLSIISAFVQNVS